MKISVEIKKRSHRYEINKTRLYDMVTNMLNIKCVLVGW